jgi:hypothetical protein
MLNRRARTEMGVSKIVCLLISLLLFSTLAASAQNHRQHPTKEDFVLLTGDAGVRSLDVYSTHWMLQNGDHEMILPDLIAHHVPVMAAYSGGSVLFNWWVMRRLEYRHPKLSHTLMMVEIEQDGYYAIHNLFLPRNATKK